MSVGMVFFIIALILFFLAGIAVFSQGVVWGLFTLTLGILLSGVPIPVRTQ